LTRSLLVIKLYQLVALAIILLIPITTIGESADGAGGLPQTEFTDEINSILPPSSAQSSSDISSNAQFPIPASAWQRAIGDIPWPTMSNDPNRGIVLGGFGAGAFMYNYSGSFGPWADETGEFSSVTLKQAAFHVFEEVGGAVHVRCLSTDTVMLPAWDKLAVGDGTYYALHPKGWCVYDCFTTNIQSEFFSPIIAHNYRETSYPVAVWQFGISNPTVDTARISIMLTWPNPPFNNGRRIRTGFANTLATAPGYTGVILKASHPLNTPETQNSEWCIATRNAGLGVISRATWNPATDGSAIWNQFADDGILSNSFNPYDSAAAIAVKVTVPPGQETVIPFAVAWDYPVVEFKSESTGDDGTQWWKRYCEYFDTLSDNSFELATLALDSYEEWGAQIDEWMSPFVDDPRYPEWLIRAAFNELYYNQFGGSFWESGLRLGHDDEFLGLHPEDHKNFLMESLVYTLSGNVSVGHYSSVVYAQFWPEMERDLLRCHADIITHYDQCNPTALYQTAPEIGAPRDFLPTDSCTIGDPFFSIDPHGYRSRSAPCESGLQHLQTETSSKFIQRCWRYYALYKDEEFLEYIWPAVENTFQFMKTYDCEAEPRDSLPDAQGYDNTYDGWAMYGTGTDMYSGGFWVGALQAMDTMAALLDAPIRDEIKAWLEAARRNLDEQLWDSDERYYYLDTGSDYPMAVFADALGGQRYCEAYGLPNILPRWKMDAHLQKVYDICVLPNPLYGIRLGRMPDGSIVPSGDRDTYEYWVGTTYWVAAMMYHAGMKDQALTAAYGAYYPVYEDDYLAYWFNTPEAWIDGGGSPRPGTYTAYQKIAPDYPGPNAPGEAPVTPQAAAGAAISPHQYQRPRAVWELVFAIQRTPPDVPTLVRPEDFAFIVDSTPTLRWTGTLNPQGTYTLQYARDGAFTVNVTTIPSISDTSFTIPDSMGMDDGVWFWHVEAVDADGNGSGYQETPYSFSIDSGLPCDCTDLGDCNGDHKINPVDVVLLVKYVYQNAEPGPPDIPSCPAVNGDWNCDAAINPTDIVYLVNFVYKNQGLGPCDPCE